MRKYLYCENGFVEKPQWMPNCWVNVECPDQSDFEFLTKELKVPEAFLEDIADMDERPRTDTEDNWLLTIIRIPLQQQGSIPYITIPIGIITNNEIIVTVCYHSTEMIPDFIDHTRRKGIIVPNKFELILRLIYSSAVWFLKYLKQINNDVAAAEKELERSIRNEDLLRLMKLQKTLVYFNTSIRGNEVMVGKLQSIFQEKDYQNRDLVEDVVLCGIRTGSRQDCSVRTSGTGHLFLSCSTGKLNSDDTYGRRAENTDRYDESIGIQWSSYCNEICDLCPRSNA